MRGGEQALNGGFTQWMRGERKWAVNRHGQEVNRQYTSREQAVNKEGTPVHKHCIQSIDGEVDSGPTDIRLCDFSK